MKHGGIWIVVVVELHSSKPAGMNEERLNGLYGALGWEAEIFRLAESPRFPPRLQVSTMYFLTATYPILAVTHPTTEYSMYTPPLAARATRI